MKTKIQLDGIIRNIPENVVPDGALHEKINLRTVDGVLRPVGEKTILRAEHDQDVIYVHLIDNTENLISYNKNTGIVSLYSFANSTQTTILTIGTDKDVSFSHIGKLLILSNNTDKEFKYLSYNVDSSTYDIINNVFPNTPAIAFTPNTIHNTTQYGQDKYQTFSTRTPDDIRLYTENVIDGLLNTKKNEWREEGKALGFMMVQYAWKMIDGTYVKHSDPAVMYMGLIPTWSYGEEGGGTYWYQLQNLAPAKLNMLVTSNVYNNVIRNTLDNYKNTIESLCIFVTKTYDYVIHQKVTDSAGNLISPYLILKDTDNFDGNKWVETQPFYLVKEYKISEFKALTFDSWIDIDLDNLNNITTNETLGIDNYTHHSIFGEALYNYNSRFLAGNIRTKLGSPNIDKYKYTIAGYTYYDIMIEVELNTSDGTKIIKSDVYTHTVDATTPTLWVPKIMSYPDTRATYYRILAKLSTATDWRILLETALTKSNIANWAYGFVPNVYGSTDYSIVDTYLVQTATNSFIPYPLSSSGTIVNHTVNNIVSDTNRLQASEISNPYVFPAANSYQVGTSSIIAIETNTAPISQGQYGEYPLMVFTKDGIYALNLGTGETFIQSITPLSGEILLDKNSLLNTGDGIIFISGDYAVKILNGKQAESISDQLKVQEGYYENSTIDIYNKLSTNTEYQFFISDSRLSSAVNYVDVVPFYRYIQNAILIWDNDNNRKELIVSNPTYLYSYVFSFKSKSWFKVSGSYRAVTRNYPFFYGIDKNNVLRNISSEYYPYTQVDTVRTYDKKEIFIESQAIKFNEEVLKKIKRLLLHCFIEVDSDKYFSMYLFGSIDGENWNFISGKQQNGTFSNVVLSSEMVSCKYYKLIVTGKVSKDSYISYIDTEIIGKYLDKIR